MKRELKALFWTYVAFPLSAGWAVMLLAGILHPIFGTPLIGYWTCVAIMALISWIAGSWTLRASITELLTTQFVIKEFIDE